MNKNDTKTIHHIRTEPYRFGKCDCCGKRFNRSTRGQVSAKDSKGLYYGSMPWQSDHMTDFDFEGIPSTEEVTVVKLGIHCLRRLHNEGKYYDSGVGFINTKNH